MRQPYSFSRRLSSGGIGPDSAPSCGGADARLTAVSSYILRRDGICSSTLVSRECLGQRGVPSLVDLISLVAAWRRRAEEEHRIIEWRFRVDDARRVFRYEGLTTRRSGQ